MSLETITDTVSKNLWWIFGAVLGIMLIQAILMAIGIRNPIISSISSMGLNYVMPICILVLAYQRVKKE